MLLIAMLYFHYFIAESEPYINEGNFRAILMYKAKDLNHLKQFLESDGRYK